MIGILKNKRTLQSKFRKQRTKCRVRLCAYVHAQHMGRAARWLCSGVFIFPNQKSIFGRSVLDSAPTDWPPDHIARHTRRPCACQAERTDTDDDEQCSLGGRSRRRRAAKAKERRRGGSCITRRRSSLRIHFCVVRRGPRSIDGRPYLTGSHGQHTDWSIRALNSPPPQARGGARSAGSPCLPRIARLVHPPPPQS